MLDKNGFTRPTYNEIVEQESDKLGAIVWRKRSNKYSLSGWNHY